MEVFIKYTSTRGQVKGLSFQDAVMMGLATDGGLLVPESIPSAEHIIGQNLSYQDLALEVMKLYVTDIPEDALKNIIDKSYSTFHHDEITPVVKLNKLSILELFHGPTLAFKDLALQFLGNTFDYILEQGQTKLNIVAATSGDTGSAAIHGVRGKNNIDIFVMHPHNRTSELQRLQMTTVLDANVHNLAIEGSFDDCQAIMKDCFNDKEFKDSHSLGAVNSVNWARILAQVVYYFYAYQQSASKGEKLNFCVPTGNFGDIFAGFIAREMGLPIDKLIVATNENNILETFFQTGRYERTDVQFTISPSMDIQVASNFERYLYYREGQDSTKLSQLMQDFQEKKLLAVEVKNGSVDETFIAGSGNTQETLATIKKYWNDEEYLLDPHTAVAVHVAEEFNLENHTVVLATAHPAKFPDAITDALGEDIARHPILDELKGLEYHFELVDNDKNVVKQFVIDKLR